VQRVEWYLVQMVLEEVNQENQVVHVALQDKRSSGEHLSRIRVNGVGCASGNCVQLALLVTSVIVNLFYLL